jgi:hypothetical protein
LQQQDIDAAFSDVDATQQQAPPPPDDPPDA